MMKGASSHYVNNKLHVASLLAWDEGYGVFSLCEEQRAPAGVHG
jgi:hypothetical protein